MMNTLTDKLAQKQLAIEGKPLGPGSHTEHEGKTMTGAQAIIASLEAEGVDTVFGYPGGQAIKIYDALYDSKKLHHVLARHEQGATHMADGYARATGKVGVVLVTSGPGATNTVTGIATAYMDSIPMVVITGQVTRGVIGTDSFQESDIVGITIVTSGNTQRIGSLVYPDELRNVPNTAWSGKGAVTVNGRTYTVPASVPCYNTQTKSWVTLTEARAYADSATL